MVAGGASSVWRVAPVVLAVLLAGLLAVLAVLRPLAGEDPSDDAGGGAVRELDPTTGGTTPRVTSLTIEREVTYGLDLVVEHDVALDELWLFDLLRPVTPVHLTRGDGEGWAVVDDHGLVRVSVARDRTGEGQLVLVLRGTHAVHGWAILDPAGATTTVWPDGHPEAGTDPLVALAPGTVTGLAVGEARGGGVELVVATDGRLDELWLFTPADPMSLVRLGRHGDTFDRPVGVYHLNTHGTRGPWTPERFRLGWGDDVARWVVVDEDAATGGLVLTIGGHSPDDGWAVVDGAGNRTPGVGHLGASGLVDLPAGQVAAALAADLAAVQRGVVRLPRQTYWDFSQPGLVLALAAEQLVPGARAVRHSPADEPGATGVELVVTADWPRYAERDAGGRAGLYVTPEAVLRCGEDACEPADVVLPVQVAAALVRDPGVLTTSPLVGDEPWTATDPVRWRPVTCVEVTAAPPGTLAPGTTACVDIYSGLLVLLQDDEQRRAMVEEREPDPADLVPPG